MKTLALIFMLHFSVLVLAQKMPSDYFDEAAELFEADKLDEALDNYQYIVDRHPKNELYPRSLYNVGYIYFLKEEYDSSIMVFETILESGFDEEENLGGGLMDDPYANFKHRSCKLMSEIYYTKGMFQKSLDYFILSDVTYPYLHFCGNGYAANDVRKALGYADIYQKLNQTDMAIEKLLSVVFVQLADNSQVIEKLRELLVNKKGLKKELDNALEAIATEEVKRNGGEYTRYYFIFLGVKLDMPVSYVRKGREVDLDDNIQRVRASEFYKMIKRLK